MDKIYKPNHPTTLPTGKYFSVLVLFFASLLLFSSCGHSPSDELSSKINLDIRNQNNVDETEWNNLVAFIDSNKVSFPELLDKNQKVDATKLTAKIIELANHRRTGEAPIIFDPKSKIDAAIKPTIKVFIENSISMDGYVNGNTDFKSDLTEMLVDAKNFVGESNIQINFINSHIYPSPNKEIATFATKLEPQSITYNVGGKDRGTSDINNIFRMLLDSLPANQLIILSSDCIYSLGKGNDSEGKLNYQKSLTHDAFNDALKKSDLETVCLKMKSSFIGNYYDLNDHPTYINATRPYYIWIIGEKKLVNEYSPKLTKDMKGIENSYSLSSSSNERQPYFTLLKEKNRVGSFKQTDRHQADVRNIEDVKYENGQLQFAIAIDLHDVQVDSTYLANPRNYKVPDGFTVQSVERLNRNNLTQHDWMMVEKTTANYLVTVSLSDKVSMQNLQLDLSNQIPQWVDDANSPDDLDVKSQLDKTFGFGFLVKGVSEAYKTQYPNQKSYFPTLVVQISKEKSGGSPLTTILIWLTVIGVLIFVILILLKRRNQN